MKDKNLLVIGAFLIVGVVVGYVLSGSNVQDQGAVALSTQGVEDSNYSDLFLLNSGIDSSQEKIAIDQLSELLKARYMSQEDYDYAIKNINDLTITSSYADFILKGYVVDPTSEEILKKKPCFVIDSSGNPQNVGWYTWFGSIMHGCTRLVDTYGGRFAMSDTSVSGSELVEKKKACYIVTQDGQLNVNAVNLGTMSWFRCVFMIGGVQG